MKKTSFLNWARGRYGALASDACAKHFARKTTVDRNQALSVLDSVLIQLQEREELEPHGFVSGVLTGTLDRSRPIKR